jgi:hypothetical protein
MKEFFGGTIGGYEAQPQISQKSMSSGPSYTSARNFLA